MTYKLTAFICAGSLSRALRKESLTLLSSNISQTMTQLIETATFAELELKTRGKFENVNTPLLIMQDCTVPFGVDLDSIYCPLPLFAGGSDPRKHLSVQLEISEEAAKGFGLLDAACAERSTMLGSWSLILHTHEGRYLIKARINVEGA